MCITHLGSPHKVIQSLVLKHIQQAASSLQDPGEFCLSVYSLVCSCEGWLTEALHGNIPSDLPLPECVDLGFQVSGTVINHQAHHAVIIPAEREGSQDPVCLSSATSATSYRL